MTLGLLVASENANKHTDRQDSCFISIDKQKTTFFYKESVIHPLVKLDKLRNGLFLNNKEKNHIMHYIEGLFHD